MRKSVATKWITALALLLSPTLALADSFEPPQGDLFMGLLAQIIGTLVQAAGWEAATSNMYLGTVGDPLHVAFELITTFSMAAALVWVSISGVYSALNTTNGSTFLKDIGGAFYIGRVLVILTLLAPLPFTNGIGLGMVTATWAFKKAVGFTGLNWQGFLGLQEGLTQQSQKIGGNIQALYAIKMPNPQVSELTYKAFEGYTCTYGAASEQLFYNDFQTRAHLSAQTAQTLGTNNFAASVERQTSKFGTPTPKINQQFVGNNMIAGAVLSQPTSVEENSSQAANEREAERARIEQQNEQLVSERVKNALNARSQEVGSVSASNYISAKPILGGAGVQQIVDAYVAMRSGVHKPAAGSPNSSVQNNAPLQSISTNIAGNNNVLDFGFPEACGMIDFKTTSNLGINGRLTAEELQSQVGNYFGNNANNQDKNAQKSSQFLGATNEILERAETRRNAGINDVTQKMVLEIYRELFDEKYNAEIAQIAQRYVAAINTNARTDFVVKEGAIRLVTDNDVRQMGVLRAALRQGAARELDALAQQLEKDLINRLRDKLKNAAGASDMATNANYTDYLYMAQRQAEEKGFASMFLFMTSLQNEVAHLQNIARITPYYTETAKMLPSSAYERMAAPSMAKGNLNGDKLKVNIQHYYGFIEDFAPYSVSSMLRSKYAPVNKNTDNNPLMALAYGADLRNIGETYRHPMILAIEAGTTIIDAVEIYSNRPPQKSNNNDMAKNTAINTLVAGVYGMGIMLAYVLPALPLLYGIGALMGILVNFLAVLYMLPIALAMHLTPEGSKMAGKGAAMYPHLLTTITSPIFLGFGFMVAMVVQHVYGLFSVSLFVEGMDILSSTNYAQTNNQETGVNLQNLTSSVAVLLLFTYLLWTICMKSLAISTMLADKMSTFIGGVSNSLGDFAQSIATQIEQKVEARSSALGSGVAGMGSTGMGAPVGATAGMAGGVASPAHLQKTTVMGANGSIGQSAPVNTPDPTIVNNSRQSQDMSSTSVAGATMGGATVGGSNVVANTTNESLNNTSVTQDTPMYQTNFAVDEKPAAPVVQNNISPHTTTVGQSSTPYAEIGRENGASYVSGSQKSENPSAPTTQTLVADNQMPISGGVVSSPSAASQSYNHAPEYSGSLNGVNGGVSAQYASESNIPPSAGFAPTANNPTSEMATAPQAHAPDTANVGAAQSDTATMPTMADQNAVTSVSTPQTISNAAPVTSAAPVTPMSQSQTVAPSAATAPTAPTVAVGAGEVGGSGTTYTASAAPVMGGGSTVASAPTAMAMGQAATHAPQVQAVAPNVAPPQAVAAPQAAAQTPPVESGGNVNAHQSSINVQDNSKIV